MSQGAAPDVQLAPSLCQGVQVSNNINNNTPVDAKVMVFEVLC